MEDVNATEQQLLDSDGSVIQNENLPPIKDEILESDTVIIKQIGRGVALSGLNKSKQDTELIQIAEGNRESQSALLQSKSGYGHGVNTSLSATGGSPLSHSRARMSNVQPQKMNVDSLQDNTMKLQSTTMQKHIESMNTSNDAANLSKWGTVMRPSKMQSQPQSSLDIKYDQRKKQSKESFKRKCCAGDSTGRHTNTCVNFNQIKFDPLHVSHLDSKRLPPRHPKKFATNEQFLHKQFVSKVASKSQGAKKLRANGLYALMTQEESSKHIDDLMNLEKGIVVQRQKKPQMVQTMQKSYFKRQKRGKSARNNLEYIIQSDGDQVDINSNGEVRNVQSFKIPMIGDEEPGTHEHQATLASGTRNIAIDSAKIIKNKSSSIVYSSFPINPPDNENELFLVGKMEDINKSLLPEEQRKLISNLTNKQHWERDTNSSNIMDEHKLGQQLKLMADQLQPLNSTELQELQRNKEILPQDSSVSDKNAKQEQIQIAMNTWAKNQQQEEEPKKPIISPRPKTVYGGGYNGQAIIKKSDSASATELRRVTSKESLKKINTLGNHSKKSVTSPFTKNTKALLSPQTAHFDKGYSIENLSVVGHEISPRKERSPVSPLRVVVSSTIKINGQNKHVKVQSMIDKQNRSRSGSKKQKRLPEPIMRRIEMIPTAQPKLDTSPNNVDISNVQLAQETTSSARLLKFDVQEEFTKYQQKLKQDEQNKVYKYNLDKEFHIIIEEQPTKMNVKRANSFVSIATFTANKKGNMGIKPERNFESPLATKTGKSPNTNTNRRAQSHKNVFQLSGARSAQMKVRQNSDFNILQTLAVRGLPTQSFNQASNPSQVPQYIDDVQDHFSIKNMHQTADTKPQFQDGFILTQGTPGLNITNPISLDTFGRNLILPQPQKSGSNSITMYELTKSIESPNRIRTLDSRGDNDLQTTLKRLNQSPGLVNQVQQVPSSNFMKLQQTAVEAAAHQLQQQRLMDLQLYGHNNLDEIEQRIIDEGLQASNAAIGKVLSDEGLGITASAGATSPVEFIDSGRTRNEKNTLEAHSDKDIEEEHESQSPQKLELARYNQSNHPVQVQDQNQTSNTHMDLSNQKSKTLKYLQLDNSRSPQSSKSPGDSVGVSQAMSPSPMGVSVYPDKDPHIKGIRRPISPKEYSGIAPREESIGDSTPINKKPSFIDRNPYLASSMGVQINQPVVPTLPRLTESQSPQNIQQLLTNNQGHIQSLEQLILISQGQDAHNTNSQFSQDLQFYDSNQNLRAMLNSGQGHVIVRSNTAARIEDQLPYDPMSSLRNDPSVRISTQSPEGRITSKMKTKVSQRIFTRAVSDSRLGVSLNRMNSSRVKDEVSVAEMSAQVMMDQNEGITETSQQLNGSYGGTGFGQLLQEYHQQSRQTPNVISIGNIQKRTTSNEIDQSYPQISESQFRNVDLEKIFKEAIKYHEKRMKRSISKNTKKNLFTYFRQNAQEILLQDIDHFTQNQTKYHQKVLNENPRTQTDKNYRAFRRQDDIDIHLRHLNNDKASFQQQQDFAVRGKKLHSIKQVAIQQQLYAHMAQQIQLLQEIEFMNSNKGSVVKVNINAPNLVENFTKHLLPTISSRKNVNSNSNVQSTRRGAQRQQVQQVFSSIGHSGLNVIGGPRQMGSPLARGGESLQVNGQQQTSLVYNQHNEIQSNVAVMQAQVAKNMLSARSLYFKEVYSRDSSLAPNSPGLRGVNLNEQLSSKSGKIDPNNQNKQSSVVSHSGYGGAGMAEGIKSPRMQHLKGSMAASGYTTGLKFDVKEVQQQSEEKNSKQSVINILDQSREEKDDIMIEKSKSNNQLIDSSKFADSIHNQISEKQVNPVHDVFVVLTQRDNKSPRNNSISHQKHKLNLPIHMVRSSQFDEGSKASAGHHSQSVRETRKIVQNKEKSQTIQPVNMSHPEAIKSRGGNSQESLKKMTIYESENQISNYHITRPVMGDEIMKVSQVPIAGTLHANSIEAASIKKTILTQGGGRNTSIPFGRKNLSGNLETSNEKLWHRKQESNETLEINGLIQPKSVRAKIDLKEAQDNFYQQLEKDNSVIRSKSKLMNNIGKSFQGLKFNKTAEMISQIIRKDKGMPDYQEQPKQNNKNMVHNIERGGSHNKSVKVQYSRTKSDIPVQIDQTPDSSKQTFIDQNRKQIRLESMTNNLNTLTRLRDRSPTPEPLESIIQRGGEVFLKQKLHQDDSALYQPSGINSEKQRSVVQSRVTIPPEAPQEDMTSEQFQIQSENFEIEEMKSAAKNSIFGETGFFSGPQRLNQTLVGKNSKNHVPQNIEKLSMKTQGQVQYIIKNPTSHEISSSRLIENQKVLMSRPQRLHSAIHQGNLRRSFGYDQSILPGKERAGLIVQDNNIVLRVGEVSSYSTAGGIGTAKHISKMQMKNNNRLTSAGKFSQTHASTAIRESQFPKYQQSQALMHVQDQSEFDYIENSINNMQGARMRPRTAKVGGFVNNLRQQSGIGDMAQASGNINQVKPNRIESAHPAPIVQPQLKQDEAASSSFQILQSYNNRMLANDPSSLPFTNTFGVFSKASGGLSTSSINRISRPDLMKLHSRINSNQDLQLIQTNDEEWQQQYTSHLMKKKQEVALEMFQIPPQQQQQNRVVLQQQQQKKKKQPQGHINKIVNRKIKRGTVFKDENFEAKRRDGKNGVIVQ